MATLTLAQWQAQALAGLMGKGLTNAEAQAAIQNYLAGKDVNNQISVDFFKSFAQPPSANGQVYTATLSPSGGGAQPVAAPAGDGYARPVVSQPDGTGTTSPFTGTVTPTPTSTTTTTPTSTLTVSGTITNSDGTITEVMSDGSIQTVQNPNAPQPGLSTNAQGQQVYTDQNGNQIDFNNAIDIINSALQVVGLDPNAVATSGINAGQTLGNFFWSQITTQGITDPSTIGDMITTLLPSTGQFNVAFPGYQTALASGYVRTVADYVTAEEGITAVMLQGGIPKDLITPATVGNLIADGKSVNEVADIVTNGYDAAVNSPIEVQNAFEQEFGTGNGINALAQTFLSPNIDPVTLKKMLAGAQIQGAAAASNLPISQGLSQRLADQGQTYASAQSAFKNLTAQAGLFQATVGEASSQAPVAGTQNQNAPLTEANQGVEAAFGLNANADQQVHQAALARANEFRGGGGAANTTTSGFSGLAEAKDY